MTVVLAWRAMSVTRCDRGQQPQVVLQGARQYSHLHGLVSAPAICLGWDPQIARDHLSHPEDWQPPAEHRSPPRRPVDEVVHEPSPESPPAPDDRCSCGYYALLRPGAEASAGVVGLLIWCYVAALGKTVFYTKGVRMERYRLLRWWWPTLVREHEDWLEPVDPNAYSNVYERTMDGFRRLHWGEVVDRLTDTYGMGPSYGDPRKADLPTGLFRELPSEVVPLLTVWGA